MGFLLLLFVVLVVILMIFKIKGNDTSINSDAIEFDTQKTVQQITGVLRSIKCQMDRLNNDDPLATADGGPQPVIAVVMVGNDTLLGMGAKQWGVQAIVYELGNKRHVALIALGESGMGAAWRGYVSGDSSMSKYCDMGKSKKKRDEIAQMLA